MCVQGRSHFAVHSHDVAKPLDWFARLLDIAVQSYVCEIR